MRKIHVKYCKAGQNPIVRKVTALRDGDLLLVAYVIKVLSEYLC